MRFQIGQLDDLQPLDQTSTTKKGTVAVFVPSAAKPQMSRLPKSNPKGSSNITVICPSSIEDIWMALQKAI